MGGAFERLASPPRKVGTVRLRGSLSVVPEQKGQQAEYTLGKRKPYF